MLLTPLLSHPLPQSWFSYVCPEESKWNQHSPESRHSETTQEHLSSRTVHGSPIKATVNQKMGLCWKAVLTVWSSSTHPRCFEFVPKGSCVRNGLQVCGFGRCEPLEDGSHEKSSGQLLAHSGIAAPACHSCFCHS